MCEDEGSSPTDAHIREPGTHSLAQLAHPRDIIRRQFSIPPIDQAELRTNERPNHEVIGLGSCGSVFEIPGTDFAIKKGKDVQAIWNDFCLTNTVRNAFMDTRDLIQDAFPENTIPETPLCSFFRLPTSKEYWKVNIKRFPKKHRRAGATFQLDRILPLPQSIREALIDLYFDDKIREKAKKDRENEACLVRIYLGAKGPGTHHDNTLRNFPLRLNMIEDLGLDKTVLADELAIALAIIHWQAQVNAMDAEFVLGSAQATPADRRRGYQLGGEPHEVDGLDFTKRPIHLWVLDFDKSSRIDLTPEAVEKSLIPAFICNDPYFPRPDVDAELWKQFSKTYLRASRLVLLNKRASDEAMELPKLFIDKVASKIKEDEGHDPEEDVRFG